MDSARERRRRIPSSASRQSAEAHACRQSYRSQETLTAPFTKLSIWAAGIAPAVRAASLPPSKIAIVGIERMRKRSPSSGNASVLTLTTTKRPAFDAATFASSGATIRQGPHHGAQKSTTTGSPALLTRASKTASLGTSMGSDGGGKAVLHRPQRASRPENGRRFRWPQEGHVVMKPRSSSSMFLLMAPRSILAGAARIGRAFTVELRRAHGDVEDPKIRRSEGDLDSG